MRVADIGVLAVLFAVLTLLSRVWIGLPADTGSTTLLVALATQIAVGIVPAALLMDRRLGARVAGTALFGIAALANLVCYHYEVSFGYFPHFATLLQYGGEWEHIRSSLTTAHRLSTAAVVLIVVGAGFPIMASRLQGRTPPAAATRFLGPMLAIACLVTMALHTVPSLTANQTLRPALAPVVWLAQSAFHATPEPQAKVDNLAADLQRLKTILGSSPSAPVDPKYPLCGPSEKSDSSPNPRRVVLLILESVAHQEMYLEHAGNPVMPALRQIAAKHLAFNEFYSSSTRSAYALVELLSSIIPQTYSTLLWRRPMARFSGLPTWLKPHGYKSAYFHGASLQFENQGPYLSAVGFDEVFDLAPSGSHQPTGWGLPDDKVFDQLKRWLLANPGPTFSTLFSLSTHDPFKVPETFVSSIFPAGVEPSGQRDRFLHSLNYLDVVVEEFYTWYMREEWEKGTILLITGDHSGIVSREKGWSLVRNPDLFKVPMIFVGKDLDAKAVDPTIPKRLATHWDIPRTLTSLLGVPPDPCMQGADLLAPTFPDERFVYAVHGDQFEHLHVWSAAEGFTYNKLTKQHSAFRGPATPSQEVRFLTELLPPLNRTLFAVDAYFPDSTNATKRSAIMPSDEPIVVSHRANVEGSRGLLLENKPDAIHDAIAAGFYWIELDLMLTADGIPILMHDGILKTDAGVVDPLDYKLAELRALPNMADLMTLDECLQTFGSEAGFLLELKPQKSWTATRDFTDAVLAVVERHADTASVVFDSFDVNLATLLASRTALPVAWDLPLQIRTEAFELASAAASGLDWIYVEHSRLTNALVAEAHRQGLKVMVYTVNAPEDLERVLPAKPDGILTDYKAIKNVMERSPQN